MAKLAPQPFLWVYTALGLMFLKMLDSFLIGHAMKSRNRSKCCISSKDKSTVFPNNQISNSKSPIPPKPLGVSSLEVLKMRLDSYLSGMI